MMKKNRKRGSKEERKSGRAEKAEKKKIGGQVFFIRGNSGNSWACFVLNINNRMAIYETLL